MPSPRERSRPGVVDLVELLEDPARLLGAMPMPVSRTSIHTVSPRSRAITAHRPPLRGVLERVVHQVRQHAVQQLRIAAHPQAAGAHAQLQLALLGLRREQCG
jgi:hypothetical protein